MFYKPDIGTVEGTKSFSRSVFVGLAAKFLSEDRLDVHAKLSDEDVRRLEGHLGLSKIFTVEAIREAVEEWERKFVVGSST